jgi:homoserine dehydrogenase
MVPADNLLAKVDGVFNAVRLVGDFVGPVMLYGRGAGMEATASAVMGDVMAIGRDLLAGSANRTPALGCRPEYLTDLPVRKMDDIVSHYYLRFTVLDQPGVLTRISGVLGDFKISIASMIQPERQEGERVPIVIMTHDARESDIRSALKEIDNLPAVQENSRFIRIENEIE